MRRRPQPVAVSIFQTWWRVVDVGDFDEFDYVLAMDQDNYMALSAVCPDQHVDKSTCSWISRRRCAHVRSRTLTAAVPPGLIACSTWSRPRRRVCLKRSGGNTWGDAARFPGLTGRN